MKNEYPLRIYHMNHSITHMSLTTPSPPFHRSRSDFTFLATASNPEAILQNLDCKLSNTLTEAASTPFREGRNRDPLITCSPQDSLQTIFEIFYCTKFRRIVCVDADGRCRGLISVSDLLRYFSL